GHESRVSIAIAPCVRRGAAPRIPRYRSVAACRRRFRREDNELRSEEYLSEHATTGAQCRNVRRLLFAPTGRRAADAACAIASSTRLPAHPALAASCDHSTSPPSTPSPPASRLGAWPTRRSCTTRRQPSLGWVRGAEGVSGARCSSPASTDH